MPAFPKPSMAKKKKRKRVTPLPALIKKADKIFAAFIRKRDPKCCTCGAPTTQAGHFISRSVKKLRWNPFNVHGQCCRCNHFLSGALDNYSAFIINKYGMYIFNQLMEQKNVPHKVTREEVEKVIQAYS